jgi:hypothetical protein
LSFIVDSLILWYIYQLGESAFWKAVTLVV